MLRLRANPSRVRHAPGQMNRQEAEYAALLDADWKAGRIARFYFERVTLKLAADTRYTPDFMVVMPDGVIRLDEVKGFMEEDAYAKFKIAADLFPFTFRLARKRAKKDGGGWDLKDYPNNGATQ